MWLLQTAPSSARQRCPRPVWKYASSRRRDRDSRNGLNACCSARSGGLQPLIAVFCGVSTKEKLGTRADHEISALRLTLLILAFACVWEAEHFAPQSVHGLTAQFSSVMMQRAGHPMHLEIVKDTIREETRSGARCVATLRNAAQPPPDGAMKVRMSTDSVAHIHLEPAHFDGAVELRQHCGSDPPVVDATVVLMNSSRVIFFRSHLASVVKVCVQQNQGKEQHKDCIHASKIGRPS